TPTQSARSLPVSQPAKTNTPLPRSEAPSRRRPLQLDLTSLAGHQCLRILLPRSTLLLPLSLSLSHCVTSVSSRFKTIPPASKNFTTNSANFSAGFKILFSRTKASLVWPLPP
uniref:Ovule protein n=1 Tax=Mesocestoides corti TaxID=53468 RepID=A0A5K3G1Q2_MESCO